MRGLNYPRRNKVVTGCNELVRVVVYAWIRIACLYVTVRESHYNTCMITCAAHVLLPRLEPTVHRSGLPEHPNNSFSFVPVSLIPYCYGQNHRTHLPHAHRGG